MLGKHYTNTILLLKIVCIYIFLETESYCVPLTSLELSAICVLGLKVYINI